LLPCAFAYSVISCVLGNMCLGQVCRSFTCGSTLFSSCAIPSLTGLAVEINALRTGL